jgi:hypothetical protein
MPKETLREKVEKLIAKGRLLILQIEQIQQSLRLVTAPLRDGRPASARTRVGRPLVKESRRTEAHNGSRIGRGRLC